MILYKDFGHHAIRLGNWLYQYAFVLSCSKKYNEELFLPNNYYLFKYLKNLPNFDSGLKSDITIHFPHDGYCPKEIDKIFEQNRGKIVNLNLNPYAQSFKWMGDYKEYVLEMLKFKDSEVEKVKEQYKDFFNKPTIGLGIRLGLDYRNDKNFFQLPYSWYINALNDNFLNWQENYNIIVFSDNILEAQKVFKRYPFNYAEYNKSHILKYDKENFHTEKGINHLILGSLMDNFIVCSSTFTMWQAYLAENRKGNEKSLIIHPNRNFAKNYLKTMKNTVEDYYPVNWIKYEKNLEDAS